MFKIHYSGLCVQGLLRKRNEDNLWCVDHCLPIVHTDEERNLSGIVYQGDNARFAVFDGIGGEAKGEVASYYSAKAYGNAEHDLEADTVADAMNQKVLDYTWKNGIRQMGSTAVALIFGKEFIHGFNIGDSRCYRFRKGALSLMSTDHVIRDNGQYHGYLTQAIGMTEQDRPLSPDSFSSAYEDGDIYILCSDGLTKMVSDRRIQSVLQEKQLISEKLQKLKDIVLKKGAVDNTTIFLFEVRKQSFAAPRVLRKVFSGIF